LLAIGSQPANPGGERLVFSGSLSETIGAHLTVSVGDDRFKIIFVSEKTLANDKQIV
jgi:hypothetical protein